jgi:hypothetical protein
MTTSKQKEIRITLSLTANERIINFLFNILSLINITQIIQKLANINHLFLLSLAADRFYHTDGKGVTFTSYLIVEG